MPKKYFVLIGLVILGLGVLLPESKAAETIRLGEINPLTGSLALHGQEIHQGILYAVAEINERGGLLGRPVELLSRDDQSRPDVALNQAQDLIFRQKVVGLVGGYVDSLVGSIRALATRAQVPYVAAASLQQSLTANPSPFFFRVSAMSGITEPLGRFLVEVLRPKTVAIIYTATPGSTEFAGRLKQLLEAQGIKVLLFEKFRPGNPDFSVILLKLKDQPVEVLISGGFLADNLLLARQLREQQTPIKAFIAPWGVAYAKFIRELGPASEGLLGMCAWHPGITYPGTEGASAAFVAGFRAKMGQEPNTTTMHGYAAARALLAACEAALQQTGSLSGPQVSEALRHLDLVLPLGRVKFTAQGDPAAYEQVIVQIQQGTLQAVYPPTRATGRLLYPLPSVPPSGKN